MPQSHIVLTREGGDSISLLGPVMGGTSIVEVERFNRPATPHEIVDKVIAYNDRPRWIWTLDLPNLTAEQYRDLYEFWCLTQHEEFALQLTDGVTYDVGWWETDLNGSRLNSREYKVTLTFVTSDELYGSTAPPTTLPPTTDQSTTTIPPTTTEPPTTTSTEFPTSPPDTTTTEPPTSPPDTTSTAPPTSAPATTTTVPAPTTEPHCEDGTGGYFRPSDGSDPPTCWLSTNVQMIWSGKPVGVGVPDIVQLIGPTSVLVPDSWGLDVPGGTGYDILLFWSSTTALQISITDRTSGDEFYGEVSAATCGTLQGGNFSIPLTEGILGGGAASGSVNLTWCDPGPTTGHPSTEP